MKNIKKGLAVISFSFVFFPALLFSGRRALVIGIDNYLLNDKYGGKIDLVGCANDALDLRKLLMDRFDFKENEISVLLNKDATREAILQALQRLEKETNPQDWVFFSFSGHGTQVQDQNGDEKDGKDEAICPSDVDPVKQTNLISDDEISEFVRKFKDRRAFFLFDSCHSGTMKRGIVAQPSELQNAAYFARLLPPASLLKEEPQYRGTTSSQYYAEPEQGEKYGVDFAQGEGEVVVFSAAAPHQLALPVNIFTAHPNGAMTYAILRGLEGIADKNSDEVITYRELLEFSRENTKETISERYTKVLGIEQEPQIEAEAGRMDKPVFFLTPQAELSHLINTQSSFKIDFSLYGRASRTIKLKDEATYCLESEKSGYLYLFAISVEGEVTCLFPNAFQKDNFIREKEKVIIPPEDGNFSIVASEPTGRMRILALVTSRYLDLGRFCGAKALELLHTLGSDELNELVRTTRGITGVFSPAEWAAAVFEVEIVG